MNERTPAHLMENPTGNIARYATGTKTNWMKGIYPYVRNWDLFRCPSSVPLPPTDINAPVGINNTSITVNGVVMQRKVSILPNPPLLIWCQERDTSLDSALLRPTKTDMTLGPGTYIYWLAPGYSARHFGGGNLLFCDGHVKWRKLSTLSGKEFGLNSTALGEQALTSTANSEF